MISFQNKIESLFGGFVYLSPEITLVIGAVLVVVTQLIQQDEKFQFKLGISLITLLISGWMVSCSVVQGEFMNGVLWQSHIIRVLKFFILVITAGILVFPNCRTLLKHGEFHFLLLMIVLGSFMVMQSVNLLVFYVAVELISITSYVLITFNFEKKSFEAGIKYLLFGAMASGLMLYGISLLYGMTGGLEISDLFMVTSCQVSSSIWLTMALVMFFMGLFFKLALVPMHVWTPDAYEAGPTPLVALISVLPKVAVLLFFYQFVQFSGLSQIPFDWPKLLGVVALLSMIIGNLSALKQTNAKRMMAYSSIAHSGFMIIGVLVGSDLGFQSMLFYALVYGIMILGVFYFIALIEKNGITDIHELVGTGRTAPFLGGTITLIMIALVGLPPTGGFTAKLLVFSSLWEFYSISGDNFMLWLFVLGIINAVISLFYYLKIPYFMFIKQGEGQLLKVSKSNNLYLSIVLILILLIFFKPELLLNILNPSNFAF